MFIPSPRMNKDTILEAIVFLCAIFNLITLFRRMWPMAEIGPVDMDLTSIYSYIGDDYPEHLPLPSPLYPTSSPSSSPPITTFHPSTSPYPISGPDASELWESIYPPGYGFVRLGPQSRLLSVAMFHQLQCLDKMRIWLDSGEDEVEKEEKGWRDQQHCMNYLRQVFLCRGDLTLEPLDVDMEELTSGGLGADVSGGEDGFEGLDLVMKSGEGVERTCADWSLLYERTEMNYVEWKARWNTSSPW